MFLQCSAFYTAARHTVKKSSLQPRPYFYDLAEKPSNNDVLVPCLCLGKKKEEKDRAENENTRTGKLDAKNGHVLFRRPSFSSFVNGRDCWTPFTHFCVCVCVRIM